jgi:hypothetical protein
MPRETPYSSPVVYLPLHPLSFDNAGQFGNFEPQELRRGRWLISGCTDCSGLDDSVALVEGIQMRVHS